MIGFDTFKRLRLQSVGLPISLLDPTSKAPLRMQARTMEEELTLNPPTETTGGPPHKKARVAAVV